MKLVNKFNIPKGADEAAGYWLMRLDSPECGPVDRAAFEAWRSTNPDHEKAFARAQRALAVVDRHLGSIGLTELGEQVFEETGTSHKPWYRHALAGLAVACTLVVAMALYQQTLSPPEPAGNQTVASSPTRFETATGERSTLTLPDDSIVTLNTDSLMEVRFTEASPVRRLVLVRGQAHFQVEKEARPFEVIAGDRRIVALGTAFDIRLDIEKGVVVTLEEGRVSIDEVVDQGLQSAVAGAGGPGAGIELTELAVGEQLIAIPNEVPTIVKADMEQVVSWREGRLVFRNDPLADTLSELNRYSTKKLTMGDDQRLANVYVSGVFNPGGTKSIVAALEAFYPVKARQISSDRIELLWWSRDADTSEAESLDQ